MTHSAQRERVHDPLHARRQPPALGQRDEPVGVRDDGRQAVVDGPDRRVRGHPDDRGGDLQVRRGLHQAPALRGREEVEQDLLEESDEEHHVVKLLIAELMTMTTEDHFAAKFTVMAENIEHHVKEEEGQLFPQARKTNVDFLKLGEQLLARKADLKKNGIPMNAEEKLMASNGLADSSAEAARTAKPATPLKAA